jgi:RNA polymerase sigma factor (sigma-70 family)
VARLPERQRTAISLCYLAHTTRDEAADLMGCKSATVRSLLRHGLAELRQLLPAQSSMDRRGAR